ncbi:hypothetical protein V8G54_003569 [Vigna mungo]|uniref:Uncharacterized protein n=1 Tax=Vigna mungo TaxID=3915 RepID=A0AAQ3PDU2_VIGMU
MENEMKNSHSTYSSTCNGWHNGDRNVVLRGVSPLCLCEEKTMIRTARTVKNRWKQFCGCPKYKAEEMGGVVNMVMDLKNSVKVVEKLMKLLIRAICCICVVNIIADVVVGFSKILSIQLQGIRFEFALVVWDYSVLGLGSPLQQLAFVLGFLKRMEAYL